MKFCTNCGTQLDDGAKFCTECGQKVEQVPLPVTERVVAVPVAEPEAVMPAVEPVEAEPMMEPVATVPPVEPVAQQMPASTETYVYGEPVAHSFSVPAVSESEQSVVHTYGAPVSHNFAPPVQTEAALSGTYGAAAPQSAFEPVAQPEPVAVPAAAVYTAPEPAVPVAPAEISDSGAYSIPDAAPEKAAKLPKVKLPEVKMPAVKIPEVKLPTGKLPKVNIPKQINIGGKKIRTSLIAVLVIVLIVGLFSCVGGGNDKDPNLGLYNAVSSTYGSFEMSAEGEWIELKSGGKMTMMLMGDEYSGKWELEENELTVTQAGDTYYGTLEDGVIVLDLAGLTYTYEKEVTEQDKQEKNDKAATEPAAEPEDNSDDQASGKKAYYTAISGNVSSAEMNESTINQAGGVKLVFNGDGTGSFDMFGQSEEITYDDTTITRQGMTMTYTVEGDYLYLHVSDAIEFTMMTKMDALSRSEEELTLDDMGYWEGDYYGWWVIDNVIEGDSSPEGNWWDCCMTLDINADGTGTIVIWDEDYGKSDPIAEAEVSVSNYAGVTRIVSESGQFLGDEVGHADWLFYSDATEYKDTLGFTITYDDIGLKMDCYFFLRQWGTIWDDVEESDMPSLYDSWYLPLIKDGVTTAPETVG